MIGIVAYWEKEVLLSELARQFDAEIKIINSGFEFDDDSIHEFSMDKKCSIDIVKSSEKICFLRLSFPNNQMNYNKILELLFEANGLIYAFLYDYKRWENGEDEMVRVNEFNFMAAPIIIFGKKLVNFYQEDYILSFPDIINYQKNDCNLKVTFYDLYNSDKAKQQLIKQYFRIDRLEKEPSEIRSWW